MINRRSLLTHTLLLLIVAVVASSCSTESRIVRKAVATAKLYAEARNHLRNKDHESALKIYRKLAASGDAHSQLTLGQMYFEGNGVPMDDHEAERWLFQAAAQNNAQAQHDLGKLYAYEDSALRDTNKATQWFTKAAEQGHAESQFNLGIAYEKGFGVPKSLEQAAHWFTEAAEQEHASAQFRLAVIYHDDKSRAGNQALAKQWFERSAKQGNAAAQYNLGVIYWNGRGVPKNLALAKQWIAKSADLDNAQAKTALKLLLQQEAEHQRRIKSLANTVWHLNHGERIEIKPITNRPEILNGKPKVEAALKPNGVAELAFDARLGIGKLTAGPGTWKIVDNQLTVANDTSRFSAPLTSYANSTGWYLVEEEGMGPIRLRLINHVDATIGQRNGEALSESQKDALLDTGNPVNEREFIDSINITYPTQTQQAWGGLGVAKSVSLDCLLTACPGSMVNKPPTPLTPKKGHVFIKVEAKFTNKDVVRRSFWTHLAASLIDGQGNKAKSFNWHDASGKPQYAGWTDVKLQFVAAPGRQWTVRWLFEVNQNALPVAIYYFWGEPRKIQS